MKNSAAISALLHAADDVQDPLDKLACQRAAAWVRWCDGYGATLTNEETSVIKRTKSLGDVARMIIVRLARLFPAPPEDPEFQYMDDDGSGWQHEFRRQKSHRLDIRIDDPFGLDHK
ncbi:MAG: hypothetical protein ACPGNV_08550 [Mangrovicoccus sp.]